MHTSQNHDKHDRMVKRAVRIVPARQRSHYAKMWSTELARTHSDPERKEIARIALETAQKMRIKEIGALLCGKYGAGRAALLWITITVSMLMFPVFPAIFAPVFLAAIFTSLFYAGFPPHRGYRIMTISAILFIASTGFSLWSITTQLDAADAGGNMSFLAPWTLAAFWIVAFSIILFISSCILSFKQVRP